ncbi:MAG: hypothetical protein ACP59X_12865 [Solidesulfovibrio sp. DCME]|uniref:hypothetical protein n=1 Tax=Solidesulfovibrio sp. DCME TaxID=3447380 RepID=UPI003D0F5D20
MIDFKAVNSAALSRLGDILPDNDDPGRKHARDVARQLHDLAEVVKIIELPGLPPKGDVSDWLAAGGTRESLLEMVKAAPAWEPSAEAPSDQETAEGAQDKGKPIRLINGAMSEAVDACEAILDLQQNRGPGAAHLGSRGPCPGVVWKFDL